MARSLWLKTLNCVFYSGINRASIVIKRKNRERMISIKHIYDELLLYICHLWKKKRRTVVVRIYAFKMYIYHIWKTINLYLFYHYFFFLPCISFWSKCQQNFNREHDRERHQRWQRVDWEDWKNITITFEINSIYQELLYQKHLQGKKKEREKFIIDNLYFF